jgi:hypothetical protein
MSVAVGSARGAGSTPGVGGAEHQPATEMPARADDGEKDLDGDGDEDRTETVAVDAVTCAQRRLDELAEMLYTYVGVIQRDAPPSARAPDEVEEVPADDALRNELLAKMPEYARDIVRASSDVNRAIDRIAEEVEAEIVDEDVAREAANSCENSSRQRALLLKADEESIAAGIGLRNEANRADKLLSQIRDAICQIEQ